MARPSRNTNRDDIQDGPRTFFVTSKTYVGASLLQTERMANLFIDVLRNYVIAKKFKLHDFVVMPNHFHLQLTLDGRKTIEKAVGLVKGKFPYRAKKELGCRFEIWQPGFSDEASGTVKASCAIVHTLTIIPSKPAWPTSPRTILTAPLISAQGKRLSGPKGH
ncbi:MAG TPA: transposase [Candidatus Acidoferrales bacterium]|nr:transposase [Candidatus Acidoferrales bacterium]